MLLTQVKPQGMKIIEKIKIAKLRQLKPEEKLIHEKNNCLYFSKIYLKLSYILFT